MGCSLKRGENDNLLVQKVEADPGTIGVLGYSFLKENADKIRPVEINGVLPTEATIQNLSYPGARRLYVYVKGEHAAVKPAIKGFLAQFAKEWGSGGLLEKRGLVPFVGDDAENGEFLGRPLCAARSPDPHQVSGTQAHPMILAGSACCWSSWSPHPASCLARGRATALRRAVQAGNGSTACPLITAPTPSCGRPLPHS
jgi:hypothetical protein